MGQAQPQSVGATDPVALLASQHLQLATRVDGLARHHDARLREVENRLSDMVERGFERVQATMERRFGDMDAKLVKVCDEGGEEHNQFRAGIAAINTRLDTDAARQEGRGLAFRWAGGAVNWTMDRGWTVIVSLCALVGAGGVTAPYFLRPAVAQEVRVDAALDVPAAPVNSGSSVVLALEPATSAHDAPIRGFTQ